jgi:large subunit ribosomal protein L25
MFKLEYKKREKADKLPKLSREGFIPAVYYGPKEKATSIAINTIAFKKIWKDAGESSIINLSGEGEEHDVLIQEVDAHPISGAPRHADFYVIEKGKKLQVGVPLEFEGIAPAVKDGSGSLIKVLHEIEIEAMPKDLPHDLKVDISMLATTDSQILARDIALPSGVVLITDPEEVVAAIAIAREEPEEAPVASIADIEVVGAKGKEEEAGSPDAEASKE